MESFINVKFIFYVWLGLKIIDVVTGVAQAYKNNTFESNKMRTGFFLMGGEIVLIGVLKILDYILVVDLDLANICVVYLVVMEVNSIFENLGRLGVNIPAIIKDKLVALQEGDNNGR